MPSAERGAELLVVRHGHSLANAAFRAAEQTGEAVDLGCRDADVALSPAGREQSAALGRWLRDQPPPEVVHCSPYLRARQTWQIAADELPVPPHPLVDERLRDQGMGQFELLTPAVIRSRYPDEARRRASTGEFSYRAPGGESLADVVVRVRSFLRDVDPTRRTLVIAHDAVVLALLHITESASEEDLRRVAPAANASVSRWAAPTGALRLVSYNDVHHLPTDPLD